MSERKVLNKYYPPDFDPSKIPRLKVKRDGKFGIRLMAPFNMRCNTCGEYIYKGKKFNSRKEDVVGEDYLGLHIFRFYIKCPRCVAEIAFKTDPENTDYTLEAGATRNFEAARTAERLAREELEKKEAEEKNNPMKLLENRTKASLQEMDMIETLEDLREKRQKQSAVSQSDMIESLVKDQREIEAERKRREEEEDERFIKSLFGPEGTRVVKRLESDSESDEGDGNSGPVKKMMKCADSATDILVQDTIKAPNSSSKSIKLPVNSAAKSSTTSSLQQKLLGGLIVKSKGKALSKSPAIEKNGAAAVESSGNAAIDSKQGGLASLAAYSDTDSDSD